MWDDESDCSVFFRDWFVIELKCKEDIIFFYVFAWCVGAVAVCAVLYQVRPGGVWFEVFKDFFERDAGPCDVEFCPAGDTVEVFGVVLCS